LIGCRRDIHHLFFNVQRLLSLALAVKVSPAFGADDVDVRYDSLLRRCWAG
jgi:hypothetical protein